MENKDFLFKIVIVGESAVGKTNLLFRFRHDQFLGDTKPTIGIDHSTWEGIVDGLSVGAHFWDTAGQEKFRGLTSAYYKNCHGVIVVYDISNRNSFERLPDWVNEIRAVCEPDVHVMIVGNKSDLTVTRHVTVEEGKTLSDELGADFKELSAKDNKEGQVQRTFEEFIERVTKTHNNEPKRREMNKSLSMRRSNKRSIQMKLVTPVKKGCC